MRSRRVFAAVAACGAAAAAAAVAHSVPTAGAPRAGAPWALAASPALRRLGLRDVVAVAVVTDLARAAVAVRAPAAVVCALLRAKAGVLAPAAGAGARDRVVLHVAPAPPDAHDRVPEVVAERVAALGGRAAAVLLSPDIFVSAGVLERYGAALVAGMRLWQEYMASLAVVSRPPLPAAEAELARDDCTRLDQLMVVLGRVCEVAARLECDVALALVDAETSRRAAFWRGTPAGGAAATTAAFNRAVAVAHIATCLARAFSDPDADRRVFPSLLLSGESTRDMHAVELLADQTFVRLSLRLAPAEDTDRHSAYGECASLSPAVLSVAGLQRVPAGAASHPPVLEYTRGIGDLQAARLRAAVGAADRRRPPHALVRREFVGAHNSLYAAAARTPLARDALRAESAALWTRARALARRAVVS